MQCIIISQNFSQDLTCFYEYFGLTVYDDKNDDDKNHDKKNAVTLRNLTTVCGGKKKKNLSEDEEDLFNLIYLVFVSERK